MRTAQYATATLLGGALALVTLLSLRALGPRWENKPTLGPLLLAILITAGYWLVVMLLRRYTGLVRRPTRYTMLAAASLTWALIYASVKGPEDPPIFALLGPVLWLPAIWIYRLPAHIHSARARLNQ